MSEQVAIDHRYHGIEPQVPTAEEFIRLGMNSKADAEMLYVGVCAMAIKGKDCIVASAVALHEAIIEGDANKRDEATARINEYVQNMMTLDQTLQEVKTKLA
jgi:hypothetical protein